MNRSTGYRLWTSALVLLVFLAGQWGCVRRRMTIRSNPPGALVRVDNYEIGTTPCSAEFIYYGTRDIQLVKDGYETLNVKQSFPAPWYQLPGVDFVAENFVPGELRDNHSLNYTLSPQMIVPTDQLLSRGEELRRGIQSPAQPVATPGALPPGNQVPAPIFGPPPTAGGTPLPPPDGAQGQPNTVPPPPGRLPPPETSFPRY